MSQKRLVLDQREKALLEGVVALGIDVESETLDLGDVLLQGNGKELLMERKTWKDLFSSMKDGRYREQRSRLLSWRNESRKVWYLVEGLSPCPEEREETEKIVCRHTLLRLLTAYDVPIFFLKDLKETIRWLYYLSTSSFSMEDLFRRRELSGDRIDTGRDSVLSIKKNARDPKTMVVCLFRMIPGVSISMATVLASPFPSIMDLSIALQKDRTSVETMMAGLVYTPEGKTTNTKPRRIGTKIVGRILDLLSSDLNKTGAEEVK